MEGQEVKGKEVRREGGWKAKEVIRGRRLERAEVRWGSVDRDVNEVESRQEMDLDWKGARHSNFLSF